MNVLDALDVIYDPDEISWLQSWGATSDNVLDAWQQVLVAKGFSSNVEDGIHEWLYAQTGIENTQDALAYALQNGLYTFAPVGANFDGNKGIVLNGSDVEDWTDTTNTYTVTQSTASKQPAYNNGVLTFDSSAQQYLSRAHIDEFDFGTDDFTVIMVFSTSATSTAQPLGIMGTGSVLLDGFFAQVNTHTTDEGVFLVSDGVASAQVATNGALNDGNTKIYAAYVDSTTLKSMINGVEQTATATSKDIGNSAVNFTIGTRSTNTPFYDTQVFEGDIMQIIIFTDLLKDSELTQAYNGLSEKWG